MSKIVFVLNGPNLNLLGKRQPEIYGHDTLEDVARLCADAGAAFGIEIEQKQSNYEGQIVEWIHEAIEEGGAAIVINPAAFTFTSIAILDALKMFPGPLIELHISNIHRREAIYHTSLVSPVATAVIAGLGPGGYPVAIRSMADLVTCPKA